jgi:Na+/H+ antiporter NhaA
LFHRKSPWLVLFAVGFALLVATLYVTMPHAEHAGDHHRPHLTEVTPGEVVDFLLATAHQLTGAQWGIWFWTTIPLLAMGTLVIRNLKVHGHWGEDAFVRQLVDQGGGVPLAGFTVGALVLFALLSQVNLEAYHELSEPLLWGVMSGPIAIFMSRAFVEVAYERGHLFPTRAHSLVVLGATIFGMGIPIGSYLLLSAVTGVSPDGWLTVPATDVIMVLSALYILRAPKKVVLWALAIALGDDLGSLILIMGKQTSAVLSVGGTLMEVATPLIALAVLMGLALAIGSYLSRRRAPLAWYIIPALVSWAGFYLAGFEPVLGFIPGIALLPRERQEEFLEITTLPLFVILGLFTFVTGAVDLSTFSVLSLSIFASLVLGKLIGIGGFLVAVDWYAKKQNLPFRTGLSLGAKVILAGLMGVGFKVAGINATLVFEGRELAAALLGTNMTVLWLIVLVTGGLIARARRLDLWHTDEQTEEEHH